ncbi:thiamine diphosphokinase, partial [Streptococcus agalactiae]|nr:thiamine diphosphokinase [Streptococcus agalactiae]
MTKIALFAGGDLTYFEYDFDYFVGIDRGILFLLKNGLSLDMAVGDFDSIT